MSLGYDNIAEFYNKHWGNVFSRRIAQVLNKVMLEKIPHNSNVLDLCCGSGQLAKYISRKNYLVTGIDISPEMVSKAKKNCPDGFFVTKDMLDLKNSDFNINFSGVTLTFDSLHYLSQQSELKQIFDYVYCSLEAGGIFCFDWTTKEAIKNRTNEGKPILTKDYVYIDHSTYDENLDLLTVRFTIFTPENDSWKRIEHNSNMTFFDEEELFLELCNAGFRDIKLYDLFDDFGLSGESGRKLYVCTKK